MNKIVLILAITALLSCKKKQTEPQPCPEPTPAPKKSICMFQDKSKKRLLQCTTDQDLIVKYAISYQDSGYSVYTMTATSCAECK